MSRHNFFKSLDWPTIGIYLMLVFIGWLSIFASIYDAEETHILDIFDLGQRYGMQLVWIGTAFIIAISCLLINSKFYSVLAGPIYMVSMLSLIAVLFLGVEINGSRSWFAISETLRLQPAEFSKIACSLALARIMSGNDFKLKTGSGMLSISAVIIIPATLIILEKETGLALVYASFLLALYREGLSGWFLIFGLFVIILFVLSIIWPPVSVLILITTICTVAYGLFSRKWLYILGGVLLFLLAYLFVVPIVERYTALRLDKELWFLICLSPCIITGVAYAFRSRIRQLWSVLLCFCVSVVMVYSVDYFFHSILQEHQQARIQVLLGLKDDLQGAGYNVHQSKVAIGSGELIGKGFLQGTQTKYNFVPEQTTDFIFCTIGEEHGLLGSFIVIALFLVLFYRIILIAERQKDPFNRIYGYCVLACLFFHFFINIGMTIGVMPVIGIPLPFISYGGSSLWAFTILLFILLKLDAMRR